MSKILERLTESRSFGAKWGIVNLYLFTEQGLSVFDKLAENKSWDSWHDLGIVSLVVSMIGFLAFILFSAVNILLVDPEASAAAEPKNMLLIPGLNDFIPLGQAGAVAIALFVAMIVHEGGHALAMRRAGVDIEEWGVILFLGIIPIGAYVEPDAEQLVNQPIRDFSRILSAGIMNNYAVTFLSVAYFWLLPSTPGMIEVFIMHIQLVSGSQEFLTLGFMDTFIYWVFFININLAIVNTLPIAMLDGGRVYGKFIEGKFNGEPRHAIPGVGKVTTETVLKWGTSLVALFLFGFMAFGARL